MRYFVWTIGCQMNEADSERLEGGLRELGLAPTRGAAEADVVVVNSCVVRESAEEKVTGMLGSLKRLKQRRPERVIALMGCMVGPGQERDRLRERFPHVDVFMRPQEYRPLLEIVGRRKGADIQGCLKGLLPPRPSVSEHVPIIHGCDKFCSFCIIPYRRGRQRSRPVEEVVREVRLLAARGVREVTLLGQTVDAYGQDLPERPDLADLLRAVSEVDGLDRVRFLTSHPGDMTDRIVSAVADLPKVCENFNLPFQAGDDEVLRRMRRGYTNAGYRSLVERIRASVPGAAIVTDLIVGFPGETEEQFTRTYEVVRDLRFDKVHSAMYSTRPDTIASRREVDDVPPEEKRRRMRLVDELQARIQREINEGYVGGEYEVLVDGHQRGRWTARTRTDKLVYIDDARDLLGRMLTVRIDAASSWSVRGEVVGGEVPVGAAGAVPA